ncbi:CapA family protein [Phytohabitans sp. ZYX-F-186]|uniref:CapA family protein n=1 Tax=Phytohabitans maris TaxID=3071409 RepID=A0ABU0ZMI1_9ACTN|nr:CapA family protein [Phytohabitans sp. ZYX-F-186]MDQ7908247.1 CapA family protein [Phytohabitans sp. ZYX-F-186]
MPVWDGKRRPGRRRLGVLVVVVLVAGIAFVAFGSGWPPSPRSAPADNAPAEWVGAGPATSTPAGARTLTVLGAGDVLVHPPVWEQARRDATSGGFDFFPMFQGVSQTVSGADLAICHLETPLARPDGPFEGFPSFSVPPQVLQGVKRAGYEGCSTASNHSLDRGEAGVVRTIEAFEAAKLGHTGTFRSAEQANTPLVYTVRGVKVAHLAYASHFNGLSRPPGKQWLANRIEPAKVVAMAKRARAVGAEIVVLSLHWGTEYRHEPDADQRDLARELLASPYIDVILGHHAHVVQPIERIGGKWVVYGMGNELARHAEPTDGNREGIMARVTFTEQAPRRWTVTKIEAIPTWVDLQPDIRLVELSRALADPRLPESRRSTYRAALDRIRGYLFSRGAQRAGLVLAS